MIKSLMIGAVALIAATGATAATYNFKAIADAQAVEQGYDPYNIGEFSITATKGGNDAYVYLDKGNAGIGICGTLLSSHQGTNLCNPAGDDGITALDEVMKFTATSATTVDGIWMNNNHDSGSPFSATAWAISVNGGAATNYTFGDFVADNVFPGGNGHYKLSLALSLGVGDYFTVMATQGPNTYISGLSTVPVPAGAVLLLSGIGALALRRRRKAA